FAPSDNQNVSSGLGPFLEPDTHHPDAPVWVAELVHVSPARDGAALLTSEQLGISQQESVSLFESAHEIFSYYGFSLRAGLRPSHWVVTPPDTVSPKSVSPALVAQTRVNDWWPQDAASRPWRQLVNELQMTWHDHPVNQARNKAGQAAVNSIWLYGGASTSQFKTDKAASTIQWHSELLESFQTEDWSQWLEGLQRLEPAVLDALNKNNTRQTRLVLIGEDRIITLRPNLFMKAFAQLPGQATHWRKWWSPRN
ncbi:MAG: hypothetical protein H5U29_11035, partial [Pusillimonas sp.]|nr:hypothetical protein [Pusillimonas sp.]